LNSLDRDNSFDLLRLLAASAVVFTHSLRLFDLGRDPTLSVFPKDDLSSFGVLVFFAISGYLVSRSAAATATLTGFAKKRALRIVPGLLVCLGVSIVIVGGLATSLPLTEYFGSWLTWKYFLNVFLFPLQTELPGVFLQNPRQGTVNGSLWTLSSEITAYALIALIFLRKSRAAILLLLTVVLCLLIHQIFEIKGGRGLLAMKVLYDDRQNYFFLLYFNYSEACRLIAVFATAALLNFSPEHIFRPKFAIALAMSLVLFARTPLYDVAVVLFVPYVVITFGRQACTWSRRLGDLDLSYGIYLYHAPLMQLTWTLCHSGNGKIQMLCFGIALTVLAAYASWTLVERPMLAFKYRSVSAPAMA
jgi:peptidoglycan/LPS O-acetylase OafA/YrhL